MLMGLRNSNYFEDAAVFSAALVHNGLKKSDLGRKFKFPNGKTGKIVGLRPRARHPLVVKYDDSTGYTACDIAKVLMHLI
jgi:hypothetical protein